MALTSIAFLLAYIAGLGMCVFRSPQWGLYTYLAVFYLDPPSRWWSVGLPDLRWSLLAAVFTFFCVLLRKKDINRPRFTSHGVTWIFVLYVSWMWIQTSFALSDEHTTGAILFTKYLILMYLIYEIIDSTDKIRDFLLAHVAGCFYLGWLAFNAVSGERLEGVGGPGIDDANSMAMHLGTALVIGAILLMTERAWRWWFVLLAMPFILNGIILGNSRGAVIGLLAGGLTLFWLKPKAYRKQFYGFAVLGIILLLYLGHDLFWHRLATLSAVGGEQESLDFSARSRLGIVAAQWQMFLDHPFGAGHAGTAALSPDYLNAEYLTRAPGSSEAARRSSHNTFMSVLVDQGVPGVLLLLALIAWVWKSVRQTTRKLESEPRVRAYGAAIIAALMVAVAAGQFAPYLKAEVQYWCLGLLVALMANLRMSVKTESKIASDVPEAASPGMVIRREPDGDLKRNSIRARKNVARF